MNSRSLGLNFSSRGDEYIACWLRTTRKALVRGDLLLECGEFGVPALHVRRDEGDSYLANFRLPPGLVAGWHSVRLRFVDSGFSRELRIAVDLPIEVRELALKGVYDGVSWTSDRIYASTEAYISCWVKGLPENCDRENVRVYVDDMRQLVEWIGEANAEGYRQINARATAELSEGECLFRAECGGVSTAPARITVLKSPRPAT